MHRRRAAACAKLVLLAVVLSCSDTASPPDKFDDQISLDVLSGGNQTALEYTELAQPIVVQVKNAKGKGVAGQIVNFRVVQGGGSVYAGATLTDGNGIAKDWWTIGGAGFRNLLEARAVDPSTGAQLVLGSVLAFPQALIDPQVQFRCGNQTSFTPPITEPVPGECYGPGPFTPSYPNLTAITVQVRVMHDNIVPVPNMWLDFFAAHNDDAGTPPTVTPIYAKTNDQGIATMTFTTGSRPVLNTLLVVGPNGIGTTQDFKAGY